MKITTFDPVIITPEFENAVSLFEALGFEITHNPTAKPKGVSMPVFRMKHENGYHVDIMDNKGIPKDITAIRMNVNDFEEARDILTAHGFKYLDPEDMHDSPTHKGCEMVSPGGAVIAIMQHIRK